MNELIIVGKMLLEEETLKEKQRKDYMKQYYITRKKNGFIKIKERPRKIIKLEREHGSFLIEFK